MYRRPTPSCAGVTCRARRLRFAHRRSLWLDQLPSEMGGHATDDGNWKCWHPSGAPACRSPGARGAAHASYKAGLGHQWSASGSPAGPRPRQPEKRSRLQRARRELGATSSSGMNRPFPGAVSAGSSSRKRPKLSSIRARRSRAWFQPRSTSPDAELDSRADPH